MTLEQLFKDTDEGRAMIAFARSYKNFQRYLEKYANTYAIGCADGEINCPWKQTGPCAQGPDRADSCFLIRTRALFDVEYDDYEYIDALWNILQEPAIAIEIL